MQSIKKEIAFKIIIAIKQEIIAIKVEWKINNL